MALGLGWLPLMQAVVIVTGMITCYTILVALDHGHPIFPTISDTGVQKPENYIFSEFFNIASFLTLVTILIRYKMMCARMSALAADARSPKLAVAGCVLGIISAAGVSIIANFPFVLGAGATVVHLVGASVVLVCAPIYQIVDTVLSVRLQTTRRALPRVRAAIACVSTVALLGTITSFAILRFYYAPPTSNEPWDPDQQGYQAYVALAFCEWTLVLLVCLYFVTFIGEFKTFSARLVIEPITHTQPSCHDNQHTHRKWIISSHLFTSRAKEYDLNDTRSVNLEV